MTGRDDRNRIPAVRRSNSARSLWVAELLGKLAVRTGFAEREIAALPLTVPLVKALKRTENVDYFDIHTDFNPLHFRMRSVKQEDAETSNGLSRRQIP